MLRDQGEFHRDRWRSSTAKEEKEKKIVPSVGALLYEVHVQPWGGASERGRKEEWAAGRAVAAGKCQ